MPEFAVGEWNLKELVKDPKSPGFTRQLQNIETKVRKFEKNKNHLNPNISTSRFLKTLNELEDISKTVSIAIGYASLLYSANTQSDEATSLLSKMTKLGSEIENRTLFFDQWWKKHLDQKNATRLTKSAGELSEYLRHKRLIAKYSLTEPEERIINTLDVTGSTALVKLYDKITNSFQFVVKTEGKKKKYTREQLTLLVRHHKPKIREIAYQSLFTEYEKNKGVLGEIYQNLVLNWKNECLEIRKYASPISVRNIGNDVDDKTVNSLLSVCKNNSKVFQKYFSHKASMLGMKKLRRYDIYAPVVTKIKQRKYTFDQAVKLVLKTLNEFSPKLSEHAKKVFVQKHVDSSIRIGKRSGAFCSTIAPEITPYVLVNFNGRSNDVFTLAHELGHAIHSESASDKSIFVQEAPLPLAETASTFSEMLLFDEILQRVSDEEKKSILAEHIDDLYSTVMRQAFFTSFEISVHKKIGDGATVEEITQMYTKNLHEQFSNTITIPEAFGIEWSCIPHFYHSPFYCYAYSFGNLLALSFFQRYKNEGRSFVPNYLEILAAGGSKKPESLLEEHGIDITSQKFWQDGFRYIENQVERLGKI
ncbi:MAG TPA: M3 family oligoendopeptidase [Nitrosopumilaceae archaeon]|nr:M3 family oligoendopeptidase [Nitrosopumilaceae archaeon]